MRSVQHPKNIARSCRARCMLSSRKSFARNTRTDRSKNILICAFAPDNSRSKTLPERSESKDLRVNGALLQGRGKLQSSIVPYLNKRQSLQNDSLTVKSKWDGTHRPALLVLFSAHLMYTVCQLSGIHMEPAWVPTMVGASVGLGFTLLCRHGRLRHWKTPTRPLNVVITGSSRGIGKALARQFLMKGDRVMVTSSRATNVYSARLELEKEVLKLPREVGSTASVFGTRCDVSNSESISKLKAEVRRKLGRVDVWINNAGCSGSSQEFINMTNEKIENVVKTNLLGCLLCTKAAWKLMSQQEGGGHIFNMDGAGADGSATPQYAAYGATKAGIAHLLQSLKQEVASSGSPVKIHNLSPGMVLTPLLLEGSTERTRRIFNILCEHPETAAAFLVPRVRSVAAGKRSGKYIRYLTLLKALRSFITAPLHFNRFFNAQGEKVYPDEDIRLACPTYIKQLLRKGRSLARQDRDLAMIYSLSLSTSYVLLLADSHKLIPKLPFS